jgi:SagB-type dehydrogenase family enzyme
MTAETVTSGGEVLRLRSGVYLAVDRGGQEYLLHRSTSQPLGRLTELQRQALHQLAESDCADASMRADALARGGADGVADLERLLGDLRAGGWLHITVLDEHGPAYTIEPYRRPPGPPPDDPTSDLVLSRFTVIRRSGTDLLLESPRSWCALRLHNPGLVGVLGSTLQPGATTADGEQPAVLTRRLRADLAWATLLVAPADEDTTLDFRQWSPHELWFHQRSRGEGAPDRGFGRTRWAAGEFEPLPARRPSFPGPVIELDRPDLAAVRHRDATVTDALERRRSIRRHDDEHPITLAQVGEFLFRSAGIRWTAAHDGVEFLTGPNPSGGALDPLDFYLAIRLVDGLAPGLYRYDRFDHHLEQVCGSTRPVRRLIDAAQNATGGSRDSPETYPPQLVVLLAARFGRVGWSYETLAYSLILKLVGVAYQTMYLVATAMGLAPCALGAGEPAAFAEATGLEPVREATVGEFILGSRLAGPADEPDPRESGPGGSAPQVAA